MKFKENAIKPGMVIHSPKEEDARALLKHLKEKEGYEDWNMPSQLHKFYRICDNKYLSWYENPDRSRMTITEFSDLIEPEPRFKVGDKVRVRKISETEKTVPSSYIAQNYDGEEFTITSMAKCNGGILYQTNTNPYNWSETILELVNEPENKLVNAPNALNNKSNAQMSAEEVLGWLFAHYNDGAFEKTFGEEYSFDGLRDRYEDNIGEIIDRITAYEATKKEPKPVEVEHGWLCEIYDKEWHAVDEKEIWEGDEEHAKHEAAGRAKQYVAENGETALYQVYGICRVKEGK